MSKITETDRKEILGLLRKGAPAEAIKIAYDYSLDDIRALAPSGKRLSAAKTEDIRARAAAGATHAALAAEFGVHVNTIWRIAAGRTRPGVPAPETKTLTPELVAALRLRRRAGEGMRALAAELHVKLEDAVAGTQGNPPWLQVNGAEQWEDAVNGQPPLSGAEMAQLVAQWSPATDRANAEFSEGGTNNADKARRALAALCMRADSPYWVRDGKIYFI